MILGELKAVRHGSKITVTRGECIAGVELLLGMLDTLCIGIYGVAISSLHTFGCVIWCWTRRKIWAGQSSKKSRMKSRRICWVERGVRQRFTGFHDNVLAMLPLLWL